MEPIADIVKALTIIIKLMVDDPGSVRTTVATDADGKSVIMVAVSPNDAGKIIGKNGRTAQSLRAILNAIGTRAGKKIALIIAESACLA
jgi:predicted RNA-binding protein YlqC (UPF0109 family)